MKLLNINSYYLSSPLYQPMESNLIDSGIELETYVPVYPEYKIRKEIEFPLPSHVHISKCYKKLERAIFHLKHFKIKKNLLNNYNIEKYDLLHAHSLFSNGYIALQAYKKYKIPYIVTVRSADINTFFKWMFHLRKIGIDVLNNARRIIFLSKSHQVECISKYMPEDLKDKLLKKSTVIPNGIDEYWIKNKISIAKKKEEKLIKIIFVGNDSKRKNLKSLIKACDILTMQKYWVRLDIVGHISEQTKKKINSKKYIRIQGHVNKKELMYLYRDNDIFVLPSIHETFGLVYPEAMSQGLPVLYTKGQGFDRYFNEGSVGYSINSKDSYDIAFKILKTINRQEEISERSIAEVDRFSWEVVNNDYKLLYNNVKWNCN